MPYNLRGTPPAGDGQDGDDSPNASVRIRKASCPAEMAPADRFAECFQNTQRGVTFTLDGITAATGPDGEALFYQLQPGTYAIREMLIGGFADFAVFCSRNGEQVDVSRLTNGVRLFVPRDTEIIRDWYNSASLPTIARATRTKTPSPFTSCAAQPDTRGIRSMRTATTTAAQESPSRHSAPRDTGERRQPMGMAPSR